MERTKAISLSFICFLAVSMLITVAYAATATVATLHTTDANGNDKVVFDLGETIYIRWTADGTVDIKVKYQDGSIDREWIDCPSKGEIEYIPTKGPGYYAINCTGAETRIVAYGTFFVITETPIGVLIAITACFTGFGIKFLKIRKD